MKKILLIAAVMACVVAGGGRADANEEVKKAVQGQVSQEMAEMDANKDGMVSEAEFLTYRTKLYEQEQKKVFAEIDRDGDKAFSEADLEDFYNQKIQLIIDAFKGLDKKIQQK